MNFKQTALLAAKQAGEVLLHYYGKKGAIKQKLNKSLVTKADIKANKIIIKIIKKSFPSHSILSEETGFEGNSSDYKWVIDPLDGTHNFLHGIPIFGTSVALEYKNRVILGVLYFPMLKILAIAEKNKGAFLNGKRIKVSDKKNLDHAFILLNFSNPSRNKAADFIRRLANKTTDVRNFGCAVYNLLLIACGKCDGYVILTTNEWDVAAGFLLVEEAGGKITGLHGEKYTMRQRQYLVSNGKIHKKLMKHLQ